MPSAAFIQYYRQYGDWNGFLGQLIAYANAKLHNSLPLYRGGELFEWHSILAKGTLIEMQHITL